MLDRFRGKFAKLAKPRAPSYFMSRWSLTLQTYNQAVLEMALAGLNALTTSAHAKTAKRTAAQESHFLCSWMVESLKEKRFSKLIADDLTAWIRQGRSMGAAANLKNLLERIVHHYQLIETFATAEQVAPIGTRIAEWIVELSQQNWLTFTDTDVDTKLKLDSDGQASLIISAAQYVQYIQAGEVIKPITLFVRGDEKQLAQTALAHGILLSQGNKKTSLVKHHKAYQIYPKNQLPALALLTEAIN